MTLITLQNGKVVVRGGQVGTEQECCCLNCLCNACPESLGFSVTFYGTRDGTLTFTHQHVTASGSSSVALCDRSGESTSFYLYMSEDEVIPFGFRNIAQATISVACGPAYEVDARNWYVSVTGKILTNNQGDQVTFNFASVLDFCEDNGLPVIDTNLLTALEPCTVEATGVPVDPCPIRVTASIIT